MGEIYGNASKDSSVSVSSHSNQLWKEQARPSLSVVMIGHRSADLLSRAIASLLRHSPAGGTTPWELVLLVNGEDKAVGDFAAELLGAESLPMSVVRVPERRPGAARNAALRAARAPVLFFLDDDIECFQDIIGAAACLFGDPALVAAGGANLTPPASGALARATGGVMGSRLGAAGMSRRYRLTEEGEADEHGLILCNLAVRREIFDRENGFAAHLISNEENVLLQRLAAKGARLVSSPRLAVYHRRRDTWSGLCAQAAKYGAGRAQNLLLVPESLRPLYFLPLLFTGYLAALPALVAYYGAAQLLPAALYLAVAALSSMARALWLRDPAQLLGVFVFPALHVSYGLGFLRALLAWTWRRADLREHAT
jgi:hypothetical protein